jgi:general nucleoside transport system permease protein
LDQDERRIEFWTPYRGCIVIHLVKRPQPSRGWSYATPLLAVLMTMVAGGAMFAALGKNPVEVIRTIFWDPLFGEFAFYFRGQLLVKAAPLILIAVGLSLGFRAGIWNIGAEGQYILGAICGAAVGLAFYPTESVFIFPLMAIAGALGGWAWAMIPAILKTKFNTNEILVSLLLVYVAEQLLAKMALGALRNPDGAGFPGSRNLSQYPSAANQELIAGTGMHWGVVAAFIAVIFAYVLFARHMWGFQIRLTGESPRAARFGGVNPKRLVIFCLGVSGALAGLAGMFEVAGPAGQISIDFNSGYGFTAIIVAFLGRLHPVGILLAGLLMALTYIGGEAAASNLGLPSSAIQAFQGMLLFFLLAVDVLTNFQVRFGKGEVA